MVKTNKALRIDLSVCNLQIENSGELLVKNKKKGVGPDIQKVNELSRPLRKPKPKIQKVPPWHSRW